MALTALTAFNVLLFVPLVMWNDDGFALQGVGASVWVLLRGARVSCELVVLVALAPWLSRWPRAGRVVRVVTVVWLMLTLLFNCYQAAFNGIFRRPPALWEDWRFLRNLYQYVTDQLTLKWFAIGLVGGGGIVVLVGVLLWSLREVTALNNRPARRALVVFAALCVVSAVADVGPPLVDFASRSMLANYRVSQSRRAEFAALLAEPPAHQYQEYSRIKLARKPSVQWLMIEAYGELAAVSDTRDAFRVLLRRIEDRLGGQGFAMGTTYSAAPVFGGRSWLSITTSQMGVLLDTQQKYELAQRVGATAPSLPRFFKQQGYQTVTIQPGHTFRGHLESLDMFNRDVVLDGPRLGYTGRPFGWQHIPDQFTLGRLKALVPTLRRPYYLFYMSLSTHHPWDTKFSWVHDWTRLNDPAIDEWKEANPWAPIAERSAIGLERRAQYFDTLEYEWRGLADVIESEGLDDTLFIVVGDHQPLLDANPGAVVSWRTLVHVISKDRAWVERFDKHGFQPGLFVEPAPEKALAHEGLFSLVVTELAAHVHDDAAVPLTVAPRGVSLSSIFE